jgi:TonB family protein
MPRRPALRLAIALFPGLLLLFLPALTAAEPTQSPIDPSEVLKNAQKLYELRQFAEAAAEFERANQLSGGHCSPCLVGMARAYASSGRRDRAITAAREAIQLHAPAPVLAQAYNQLAAALVGDRADAKTLAEAEAALRKAVELDGQSLYRFNLAATLLRENHPAEALDLARQVATSPVERMAREAHFLICEARAALPETAPAPPKEGGGDPGAMRVSRDQVVPNAVTRPEIISRTQPQYTEAARKSGVEGTVILESILDEEGCVMSLKVLKSLDPGMDASAMEAVRHWVFQPAMYQGKPVKVYYSLTINFAIDKKAVPRPF